MYYCSTYVSCVCGVCVFLSPEGGKVVMGLEGKNWFAFELPATLAHLLSCGRGGVEVTLAAGLSGRLGRLSPGHREFLCGLNTFLVNNTSFDN